MVTSKLPLVVLSLSFACSDDTAAPNASDASVPEASQDGPISDVKAEAGPVCAGDVLAPFEGTPAYYSQFKYVHNDPTYFPIAVWFQNADNAAKYSALGINIVVNLSGGTSDAALAKITAAKLQAVIDQDMVGLNHVGEDEILAWTQPDEPDNAQPDGKGGYLPCIDPKVLQQRYADRKAKDPNRIVHLNFGRGVSDVNWIGRGTCTGNTSMYADYVKAGDVIGYDIYPVADDQSQLWFVARGVDSLRGWANYKKPVLNWIETTAFNGGTKPTPEQVRAEVWMSLVHGSLGIGYFVHIFSPNFVEAGLLADPMMSSAVSAINARISSLAPALNTPSIANGATTISSNTAVPVDTMVKRQGGYTYLFAVGMRPDTTKATFALTCVPPNAKVEVLDESRTIDMKGTTFEDSFTPYGVHLYRIAM